MSEYEILGFNLAGLFAAIPMIFLFLLVLWKLAASSDEEG